MPKPSNRPQRKVIPSGILHEAVLSMLSVPKFDAVCNKYTERDEQLV